MFLINKIRRKCFSELIFRFFTRKKNSQAIKKVYLIFKKANKNPYGFFTGDLRGKIIRMSESWERSLRNLFFYLAGWNIRKEQIPDEHQTSQNRLNDIQYLSL